MNDSQVLPAPFAELNVEIPPRGWVFVKGKLVLVWCQGGIHGVAYYRLQHTAKAVLKELGGGFTACQVTIREAAKIAKLKAESTPCKAVMLMDVLAEPYPVYVV